MPHLGELAALGAAFCWAGSALSFASASERVGSLSVNVIRLFMGLAMLSLTTTATRGLPLPIDATPSAWLWLTLSGLVGFTLGDLLLFRAFVELGPRLSMLVMSLAPPFAALFGWLGLGEVLRPTHLIGMALTVGGIAWAVSARSGPGDAAGATAPRPTMRGVLLALGGALGQGGGIVLSKHGMGSYDAVAATEIRVIAGVVSVSALLGVLGFWPRVRLALRDRRAMAATAVGSFFGPFVGVSLSLLAVQHTETGVAASLMATTPIVIIPLSVWLRGERVGVGGIGGSILAVAGVALLFL